MNAIIISAIWGVVMMYSGVLLKRNSTVRAVAIVGLILLLAVNIAELYGHTLFKINTRDMLVVTKFGLIFNSIAFGSTLFYFFLSARDLQNVGHHVAEYFALIFFVLSGVA